MHPAAFTHILLPQAVHKLWEDVICHHCLCYVITVTGQAPQGKGRGLLYTGDIVQEKGPKKLHHTRMQHDIHVLGPGGCLSHRRHKGNT